MIEHSSKFHWLFAHTIETKGSRMDFIFQTHQFNQTCTDHGASSSTINHSTCFPRVINQNINLWDVTGHRLIGSNIIGWSGHFSKTFLSFTITKKSCTLTVWRVSTIILFKLLLLLLIPFWESSPIHQICRVSHNSRLRLFITSTLLTNTFNNIFNYIQIFKFTQQRKQIISQNTVTLQPIQQR